jgi:hypothetical protein
MSDLLFGRCNYDEKRRQQQKEQCHMSKSVVLIYSYGSGTTTITSAFFKAAKVFMQDKRNFLNTKRNWNFSILKRGQ